MASILLAVFYFFIAFLVLVLCLKSAGRRGYSLCLALFFYHLLLSGAYYRFADGQEIDAFFYWRDALDFGCVNWPVGTSFVKCVSAFAMPVDVDQWVLYFLFFIFGFVGCWLIALAAKGCHDGFKRFWWLLFLPGLHFWTGAPGKDAIVILGSGIFIYGLVHGQKFFLSMLGLAVVALARPHVGVVLLISFLVSVLIFKRFQFWKKLAIFMAFFVVGWVSLDYVSIYLSAYGDFSFGDVGGFVEQRQGLNKGGSSVDFSSYSVFEIVLTYLFRPLFFDAAGWSGVLASIENIFLLVGMLFLISYCLWRRKFELDFVTFFCLFYSVFLLIVLSLTTSNIGLALRQKWMFLPFLIFAFISMALGRRKKGG